MFTIQVCWSDGHIANEWVSDKDTEEEVIQEGKRELRSPIFEGDYVRILTIDCELVWDSRKEES
jgi:hypothetical protein